MRLAGSIFAVAAIVYFSHAIYSQRQALAQINWSTGAVAGGLIAILLSLCGYFLSAAAWHLLCMAVGGTIHPRRSAGIYLTSQFGKYLPGNVAQHIGRLIVAVRSGMTAPDVATTQATEILLTVTVMGGTALIGGTSLLADHVRRPNITDTSWLLFAGAVAILAVAGIHLLKGFPAIRQVMHPLRQLLGTRRGFRFLTASSFLLLFNLGTSAAALGAILSSLSSHDLGIAGLAAIYAVAWVLGFLTPGAPAGLGIRESAMMNMLTAAGYEESFAIGACLLFRAVTTVTDALAFAIGTILMRGSHVESPEYTPPTSH